MNSGNYILQSFGRYLRYNERGYTSLRGKVQHKGVREISFRESM